MIRALVFLGGGKAAADAHIELEIKFMFPVDGADQLLRIQHFKTLDSLDVASGHFAFLGYRERKLFWLVVLAVRFEFHSLKVEDDIGHVLDHAG